MGRKVKEESECVLCLRKMKKNIQSLKTASSCITNCINEKLMSFVSPSDHRNLNDYTLFPDPKICKSCFNLVNKLHKNSIKIGNLIGASINFQLNCEAAVNGNPDEIWPDIKQMYTPCEVNKSKTIQQTAHKDISNSDYSYTSPTKNLQSQQAKCQKETDDLGSGEETDNYFDDNDTPEKLIDFKGLDEECQPNMSLSQTYNMKTRSSKHSSEGCEKMSLKMVKSQRSYPQSDVRLNLKQTDSKEVVERKTSETSIITRAKVARKKGQIKVNMKSSKVKKRVENELPQLSGKDSSFLSELSQIKPIGRDNSETVESKSTRIHRKHNSVSQDTSNDLSSKEEDESVFPGQGPFKYPHPGCKREYAHEASLLEHKASHKSKLRHACPYDDCAKAFTYLRDLKDHITLHTGEKPFKCEYDGCTKAFRLRSQYHIHKRMHTGECPYKCQNPGCDRAYMRLKSLKLHEASHLSELPFCCEECGKRFSHARYFRLHKLSHKKRQEHLIHPPEKTLPCEVCGKMFSSKLNVRRHVKIVHKGIKQKKREDEVFICEIDGCNRSFRWKSCMVRHKALKHRKEDYKHHGKLVKYICSVTECQEEFNRHNLLREHMMTVHGKQSENGNPKTFKEWLCFECGMAVTKKQLARHTDTFHSPNSMFNAHEQGIFSCMAEQCGMEFKNVEDLRTHVLSHEGNPPYQCLKEDCQKSFHLKKNLDLHMMLHNNIKPFQCTFEGCDKAFVTQMCLMRHSKAHNDGLYMCPVETCGAKFRNMNNAGGHLAGHRGEDPYVCGVCGAVFNTYNVWARHKKRHAGTVGEKVHKCPKCGKGFTLKSELKNHMPVHSKEKPYVCEVCGMGYASKAGYNSHMFSHGEKKYFCNVDGCGKGFMTPVTLKRHQAVHEKPVNLCSSCGKILRFSLKKHKCTPTKKIPQEVPAGTQQHEPGHTLQHQIYSVEMPPLIQVQPHESVSSVVHSQSFHKHQTHPAQNQNMLQFQIHQQNDNVVSKEQQQQMQNHHRLQMQQQQQNLIQQQQQQPIHLQQQQQPFPQPVQMLQQQQPQIQQLFQQTVEQLKPEQQPHLLLEQQQTQLQQQQLLSKQHLLQKPVQHHPTLKEQQYQVLPQQQQRHPPQLHSMLPFQQSIPQQPLHHIQPIIMSQSDDSVGASGTGVGVNVGNAEHDSTREPQISGIPSLSNSMSGVPINSLHIPSNIPFRPISMSTMSLTSFPPLSSSSRPLAPLPLSSTFPTVPSASVQNAAMTLTNTESVTALSLSTCDASLSNPQQTLPHYMKSDISNSLGNHIIFRANPNGI